MELVDLARRANLKPGAEARHSPRPFRSAAALTGGKSPSTMMIFVTAVRPATAGPAAPAGAVAPSPPRRRRRRLFHLPRP